MSQSTAINLAKPIQGINATRVIQALVEKGKNLATLRENPNVSFKKEELEKINRTPNNAVSNQFANQVIQLALSGNKLAVVMFRLAQLKIQGVAETIPVTIHRGKPVVIDLESLGMYYHNPSNDVEAKVMRYSKDTAVKPEDLKSGKEMPLVFRWGVTRGQDDKLYCLFDKLVKYVPNKDFTKWLVFTPVLLADIPSVAKQEDIEKPVEIDGLIFKGQDGGKKLEVSVAGPLTTRKEIRMPFFTKEDEEIKFVKLDIKHNEPLLDLFF